MKQKTTSCEVRVYELLKCPLRSKCKCKNVRNVLCFKIKWSVTRQNFLQNLSSNGEMVGTGFSRIIAAPIRTRRCLFVDHKKKLGTTFLVFIVYHHLDNYYDSTSAKKRDKGTLNIFLFSPEESFLVLHNTVRRTLVTRTLKGKEE